MMYLLTRDTVVNEKLEQCGESRGADSMWREEMSFHCVQAEFMICERTGTEENSTLREYTYFNITGTDTALYFY